MMFKRFKDIFLTFLIILFVFYLSLHTAYTQQNKKQEADQQINEFSLTGYGEKGKKSWEISGESADIFQDVVKLKKVQGNLYDKEEDIELTAERGDFDKAEGKVHLEENVIIATSSGTKMTTDSLDWDRKNQRITTKDKVNIQRDNMVTIAEGATGQPDLNKVTLEKDVKVHIDAVSEEEKGLIGKDKIIITCDGPLEIDYERSVATFKNNVEVHSKEADIYSDIMDVYFVTAKRDSSEEKEAASPVSGSKIEKIVAKGNVKIVRGENVSFSDTATYTSSDNKVVLNGRPQLIIFSEGGSFNASFGD